MGSIASQRSTIQKFFFLFHSNSDRSQQVDPTSAITAINYQEHNTADSNYYGLCYDNKTYNYTRSIQIKLTYKHNFDNIFI